MKAIGRKCVEARRNRLAPGSGSGLVWLSMTPIFSPIGFRLFALSSSCLIRESLLCFRDPLTNPLFFHMRQQVGKVDLGRKAGRVERVSLPPLSNDPVYPMRSRDYFRGRTGGNRIFACVQWSNERRGSSWIAAMNDSGTHAGAENCLGFLTRGLFPSLSSSQGG